MLPKNLRLAMARAALTELADRHSPLEVLLEKLVEKLVDPSCSTEPATPIDDKGEYRPECDQAPND